MTDVLQPGEVAVVDVKPAYTSKINWVAIIAAIAGVGTVFLMPIDAETQAKIAAGLLAAEGVLIPILRTFFSPDVISSSTSRSATATKSRGLNMPNYGAGQYKAPEHGK